jgi:hypothetical protein
MLDRATLSRYDPGRSLPFLISFSAKVKISAKTNKVRFLIQSTDERELGACEADRKTIYAAARTRVTPASVQNSRLVLPVKRESKFEWPERPG